MAIPCTHLKEELSLYIDRAVDKNLEAKLDEHLRQCANCKTYVNDLGSLTKLLSNASSTIKEEDCNIWSTLSEKLPSVCDCIQEDLSAYLDGELPPPAQEGISSHLQSCPNCLAKFNSLTKVNNLLSQGLKLPESKNIDIWAEVKSRINEDCSLIREELSAYLDKEVTILRHRAITSHMLTCSDCRSTFVGLSSTGELLQQAYQPEIPEDFDLWPQIKQKMKVIPFASREKRIGLRPNKRTYVAAAVVMAALAATMTFLTRMQSVSALEPVTAEAYLIESTIGDPADASETAAYEYP